jgi:hypothetical protein
MATKERKSFREILREEAPRNASKLETKARNASWLAKIQPKQAKELYSIKHAAVRHLFRIPEYAPIIRDAWTTGVGFLLSIQLKRTGFLLHVPFNQLNPAVQQTQGAWIARRARNQSWEPPQTTRIRDRQPKPDRRP